MHRIYILLNRMKWVFFNKIPYSKRCWDLYQYFFLRSIKKAIETDSDAISQYQLLDLIILLRWYSFNNKHKSALRCWRILTQAYCDDTLIKLISKCGNTDFKINEYVSIPAELKCYFNGKRVVILGPAENSNSSLFHDLDVLCDFGNTWLNPVNISTVSYIRGKQSRTLQNKTLKSKVPSRVEFIIQKKGSVNIEKNLNRQIPIVTLSSLVKPSQIGSLNGVQDLIVTLYGAGAQSVELRGVNFGLVNSYVTNYKEEKNLDFTQGFGAHPPVVQFLLTKAFYEKGFVIPDYCTKKVLDLSEIQFCEALQNV